MGAHVEAKVSLDRALPLAAAAARAVDEQSGMIMGALADSFEGRGRLTEALSLRIRAHKEIRTFVEVRPESKSLRRLLLRREVELGATLMRLSDTASDSTLRAKWRRDACAAYREGAGGLAGLGADAERELPDADVGEALHKGIDRCDKAAPQDR